MRRREVIKQTVLASGALLSAPLYSALLSGCSAKPSPETTFTPAAFSSEQYSLLEAVADTLLPATDTPSATDLGVVQVIDEIVGECYSDEEKVAYFQQFGVLDQYLRDQEFLNASDDERLAVLQELESVGGNFHDAWVHVKQQIVAMYLTSEQVAEEQLNYLPVPGEFEACIPLSETNGKAWAI